MAEPNDAAERAPIPESSSSSPEGLPASAPESSPPPARTTGARPSATASAARRTAPVKKMSRKEKQIRLVLIFSTPVLCLILIGLILAKLLGGPPAPKKIVLNAAQLWEKHLDKARDGQTKIQECFFVVQQGDGTVPEAAKPKWDADLAAGRKILEDTMAEMVKLRADAGEGVMEYDRDLYPIQKNIMLAQRLADETDRKLTVAYPRQYKTVMDDVSKVQKLYADSREQLTPEKRAEIVKAAEEACKKAQDLAEQWGALLDKYQVQNKTSERNDPEEDAINKLGAAVMTTRKLLKELK